MSWCRAAGRNIFWLPVWGREHLHHAFALGAREYLTNRSGTADLQLRLASGAGYAEGFHGLFRLAAKVIGLEALEKFQLVSSGECGVRDCPRGS